MEVLRGQVYYVMPTEPTIGSEMRPGRPAIVVSADWINATSSVVEVVYLTTQDKKEMGTHVRIEATGRESTALCEQISTVAIERLGSYCGCLDRYEMDAVDKALSESLCLDGEDVEKSPETLLRNAVRQARTMGAEAGPYLMGTLDYYLGK